VNVNVTEDTIDLSGTVMTGKEKQTAKRIAQSYAGNRKVKDHLTVTGRGHGANTGTNPGMNNPDNSTTTNPSSNTGNSGSNPPSTSTGTNSTTNPEGNKTNPPSGTQPPKR
jgi:hypothetical protein